MSPSKQKTTWQQQLSPKQRQLVDLSWDLCNRERHDKISLADYSFLVFPMAKAYEGFLKKYLFDQGLITAKVYYGKRFRIGRALNPDIRLNQRDKYWLYDDIVKNCGEEMARKLWDTWLSCRNRIFHFFPEKPTFLTLSEAEKKLILVSDTMERLIACKRAPLARN